MREMNKAELINLAYEELYDTKCLNPFGKCCGMCNNGYDDE